jgi:hypothetical protein
MRISLPARRRVCLAGLGLLAVAVLPAPSAHAAKLSVASNGSDDAACGVSARPCRSIGQAIANATPGDTIEVGPGRYGDSNADGDFDDPGDEAAEVDVGCDCVIHVDKLLAIVSRDGAGSALIAAAAPADLVRIDAAGTIFGKPKHGFTLRGSGGSGLASDADRLTVAGNIAIGNTEGGFEVFGDRSTVADNRALDNGFSGFNVQFSQGVIRGNVAIGNGTTGFSPDGDNLIIGNAAIANGNDGFHMNGTDSLLMSNVALGNGAVGFSLSGRDLLTGNVASGNLRGVQIRSGNVVTKNAIVGNLGVGVLDTNGAGGLVTKNSIFGNHVATDALIAGSNCGVLLGAGVQTPPLLTQNFWGAPAGPGGDPADAICLEAPLGAPLVIDPVATREIKIKVKAAQ